MSLLDAYGVPYFVHNYHFGGLYPVPAIELYNLRRIIVPTDVAVDARQLLDDFLPGIESTTYNMSSRDRLRVFVEFLLFGGWFIPGNKWPRNGAA
jgi:hypothetical protein